MSNRWCRVVLFSSAEPTVQPVGYAPPRVLRALTVKQVNGMILETTTAHEHRERARRLSVSRASFLSGVITRRSSGPTCDASRVVRKEVESVVSNYWRH